MRRVNKSRGSAFAMTLVLLVFLTYFSVLIANMAYTNLQLSRNYSKDRRMYRGTDYVVNIISKRLSEAIKGIQEKAKEATEMELQKPESDSSEENTLRNLHDDNGYLTHEGAMPYEDYDSEFAKLYVTKYDKLLRDSNYGKGTIPGDTLKELSNNGEEKDGYYKFSLVKGENIYYRIVEGKFRDNTIEFIIETKYEYTNEIHEGSMQQDTITTVKFKLSNGLESFNLLNSRTVNKKNDMLPAFTNKMALLAEKNIIFKGGSGKKIDIEGDVVAFGYVPVDENGEEKANATWNDYGGVIFGYSKKLEKENGEIFGETSLKASDACDAGDVTIDGDVSTLGYVNIAKNQRGNINICGDTYARQFIMSEDSHRANVWLGYGYADADENNSIRQYNVVGGGTAALSRNAILGKGNLYVTDDLQVDSSFAKLVVEGDYYGLADMYINVGGSRRGTDMSDERRTSTININGDSVVELRNKVYVGGTSVLTKIRDNDGVAYVTGISGAKTSQISAEAYIKSAKNPYVYKNDGTKESPEPTLVEAEEKFYTNTEEDESDKRITMINGYSGALEEGFDLNKRAYHFKEYFKEKVLNNFGLMGTMNFGNLRIKTEGKKIQGWAEGVLIAAGVEDFNSIIDTSEVKAYFGTEFSESETKVFGAKDENPASQYSIIQKYQASQATFLETATFGNEGRKIVQTKVDKHLVDYLNRSTSVLNDIKNKVKDDGTYLHENESIGAYFYYSDNTNSAVEIRPGDYEGEIYVLPDSGIGKYMEKGIIFVEGDVFIDERVEFEGVVIATGNIVVSGSVKITRKADTDGMDVVRRLIDEDYYVRTFFGQNEYDINDDNMDVERVGQDYVKIVNYEVRKG